MSYAETRERRARARERAASRARPNPSPADYLARILLYASPGSNAGRQRRRDR